MKLTCEREKLLHAFQTAASVAPSRSPKRTLQNVKFEATSERATLMATDLEVGIRIDVLGVELDVPGKMLLPVDRVGMILRESSDEKLHLESDGAKTHVWGERSEFYFPSENPDEFPDTPEFREDQFHQIPARLFREVVRRTVFATDPESGRYALGGVLIELSEDQIIAVATDGRRLARQQGAARSVGGHKTRDNTIIPTRSMQLLERASADNEEEIQLAVRENDVLVRSQRTTVCTRMLEGRYPKWRDVFPRQEHMTRIELNVGPFHAAVRQSAIVTSREHRGVDFAFGDGRLVLSTRGAELGDARVELPIAYEGEELTVTLDPRFVADFLRVLDPDQTFTLCLRDSESPVVCSTGDGYSYVIMPLATRD
ncbi:MAG: DNA polymerase III subunit beta [Thermoguttaceae bacterium]|nr:DNA polymerase III subunit beta [Thermoguttaceae bacterium]